MSRFFANLAHREITHLLILAMVCGLFFFAPMDFRGLWEPDEARHAEMAREMVESGDWITPTLNYVKYFEKPVLTFWGMALSFKIFGISEASARLVPALSASMVVMLIYFIGRRLWNSNAGFWSALCLASSFMFIVLSQIILVDMPLCLGVVLAVLGALKLKDGQGLGRYLFWGGSALGFLTKGALGAGLPFLIVLCFVLCSREWGLLKQVLRLRGILFFIILCLPWYLLVSLRNPEFLPFFWDENWQRLLTDKHSRWQPPWFYLYVLPAGFLPWIVFFPWAVGKLWVGWKELKSAQGRPALWVLVWFVAYFLFFSVSSSKMLHYALPMLPPMALITGHALAHFFAFGVQEKNTPFLRRSLAFLALLFLIAGIALPIASVYVREFSEYRISLAALVFPLALLALALWLYLWRARWWMVAIGPLVSILVIMMCLGPLLAPFENWRSMKGVFSVIEFSLRSDDTLVSYGDNYYGIAYYGKRRMVLANSVGELEFGRNLDPHREKWFLTTDDELIDLLKSRNKRVVVIARLRHYDDLQEKMAQIPQLSVFEWLRLDGKVVFSNQPR